MGVFEDITAAAEALTDARENTEPRWEWDANRNRKPLKPHKTVQPGLIEQLRQAVEPGASGSDNGGESGGGVLPCNVSAVSLLGSIEHGARWRAFQWGMDVKDRPTVEDVIRGLVGIVMAQPSELAKLDFRAELRSWRMQAEVICGWRTPSRPLPAPCPAVDCGASGSLLARVDDQEPSAVCVACGERWADENEIRVLASYVNSYREQSDARTRAARTRAVEDRRRREGKTRAAA